MNEEDVLVKLKVIQLNQLTISTKLHHLIIKVNITIVSPPGLTNGFTEEELVPSKEPEKSCSSTVAGKIDFDEDLPRLTLEMHSLIYVGR